MKKRVALLMVLAFVINLGCEKGEVSPIPTSLTTEPYQEQPLPSSAKIHRVEWEGPSMVAHLAIGNQRVFYLVKNGQDVAPMVFMGTSKSMAHSLWPNGPWDFLEYSFLVGGYVSRFGTDMTNSANAKGGAIVSFINKSGDELWINLDHAHSRAMKSL